MKNDKELAWLMERIIHKYIQYEKIPQQYCDGLVLTQPEIHTIAIIGDNEGINITGLAKTRGITKGAASQMIYKLRDKGLVEKRVSPDSDAELNLFLTEMGKKAREEHLNRHKTNGQKFASILNRVPKEAKSAMVEFFEAFEKELDRISG